MVLVGGRAGVFFIQLSVVGQTGFNGNGNSRHFQIETESFKVPSKYATKKLRDV